MALESRYQLATHLTPKRDARAVEMDVEQAWEATIKQGGTV